MLLFRNTLKCRGGQNILQTLESGEMADLLYNNAFFDGVQTDKRFN